MLAMTSTIGFEKASINHHCTPAVPSIFAKDSVGREAIKWKNLKLPLHQNLCANERSRGKEVVVPYGKSISSSPQKCICNNDAQLLASARNVHPKALEVG
jgi:hypothetical protein